MRTVIAAIIGTLILYTWGMAAWLALPLHARTFETLPRGTETAEFLQQQHLREGTYVYPNMPSEAAGGTPEEQRQHLERFEADHRRGPFVTIMFQPQGSEPMPPSMLAIGAVNDLLVASVLAFVLSWAAAGGANFLQRTGIVLAVGLMVAVASYGQLWNWMRFPFQFSLDMMLDVWLGFALAGTAMAAIIREKRQPPLPTSHSVPPAM